VRDTIPPQFPAEWQPLVDKAALAIRALAVDGAAKEKFLNDPLLRPITQRVAQRYVAGRTIEEALERAASINRAGHKASIEYMGESVRDAAFANAETEVFLRLIRAAGERQLDSTISFDLSHVGSMISPELGYQNTRRMARAAAEHGLELIISMEASDRVDDIFAVYRRLHEEDGLNTVGITMAAKLHRSVDDLPKLMALPGRIRLVKGAFFESEAIAWPRNSPELAAVYCRFAKYLLASGHTCSIATHDRSIQAELTGFITQQGIQQGHYEFESLIGLGTEQVAGLHARGFPTREYAVFGEDTFLYVLNRISEEPIRVYQAIIDAMGAA